MLMISPASFGWQFPFLASVLFLFSGAAVAQPSLAEEEYSRPLLDVPYVPTPEETVFRMLELADVQSDDYLIDLGSGDGRIVVAAARDWGVKRALGIDLDPERVTEANASAKTAGVDDRVSFEQGDLFDKDFSDVDVLTMYLLPMINLRLRPVILENLRPGTRVVSHAFDMGDWAPDKTITVNSRHVYKWIVPARVNGQWEVTKSNGDIFTIEFKQEYQNVGGSAVIERRAFPIAYANLSGTRLDFTVNGEHYSGEINGDRIDATAGKLVASGWHARRM